MHILRKTVVLCGLMVMAAMANATMGALDATISIDRAVNSPTLMVKYNGANASLVELRINGESIATKQVAQDKDNGELSFTLDLASLKDGDNTIEIRLFDKSGRIVGTEKDTLTTDDGSPAPFYLDGPKAGATVLGPVEVSVGFGKAFTGSFVTFYIDNQLRSAINQPPFTYLWDTGRESNGWHELESCLVDDSNTTYRSKKIKVFVNNPSGHTLRHNAEKRQSDPTAPVTPAGPSVKAGTTPSIVKVTQPVKNDVKVIPAIKPTPAPLELKSSDNTARLNLAGGVSGMKPTRTGVGIATGPKLLTPTGTRVASQPKIASSYLPPVKPILPPIGNPLTAIKLMPITRGSRLPNLSSFSILMNGEFINFDVAPRVDEGVPMTPLRFLFERDGGKVSWNGIDKTVSATAEGQDVFVKIGDVMAKVNESPLQMERAAYIESGRTIVPLSFIREALKVDVQYDKATGHVLITSAKK